MIHCANLQKSYRMGDTEVRALAGVDVSIAAGEFIAIMGPSGSGKSTLMHVLGLLDAPDAGSYKLLGREVSHLSDDELGALRSRSVGFVFQQFNLLPRMSALENARLPLIYSDNGAGGAAPEELLIQVGLRDRMGHAPNEMSGGQQQRVAIARAMVNHPRIIFADEPTGNLDSKSQDEIMGLFRDLNARGITIVLVTHEEEVARHARRILRMRDGKILSDERRAPESPSTSDAAQRVESPHVSAPTSRWQREVFEHFRQAGRALLANKIRTGLSVLGILIGVAAVIAMLALGTGAQKSIEARLASMGSNLLVLRPGSMRSHGVMLEAGTVTRFTMEDADAIRRISSVKRVSPSASGRAQIDYANKNWNTQVMGTIPEYAVMRAAEPTIGRFFTPEEEQSRAKVAVIGMTVVRQMFGGDGAGGTPVNPIGEFIKINRVNFQVIGILPEKGATSWRDEDDLIVVPLSTAMKRLFGKDYVDNIDVEVADPARMEAVESSLREAVIQRHRLAPNRYDSFQIRNMAQMQEALSETSKTMSMLLASIAAISLLVGGIGIMNIMLVSVTERTREIGLRKAVGARRRDILGQFLIEAVVVGLTGGLAGIVLGWLITLGMAHLAGWTTAISLSSVILAFFFSAAVGVVFGLWPAQKASRLNPIEALRYE